MSSTGSQVKEESCPQSSPQPGRSGRSVPAPARTAGQSCLETQHTHLEHPERGHCQPEWGLGQHGHDSKCRSTSQVPALALCLQPSPLNVIFPHCRLHFYRSSHGNIPHTLSRSLCFFPFPPPQRSSVYLAWAPKQSLDGFMNSQTITNMAGCLALLISHQQCFIFPSAVSFWISRALLISSFPLWDATVEHYGIQICQWAGSISLICLDNKKVLVAFR